MARLQFMFYTVVWLLSHRWPLYPHMCAYRPFRGIPDDVINSPRSICMIYWFNFYRTVVNKAIGPCTTTANPTTRDDSAKAKLSRASSWGTAESSQKSTRRRPYLILQTHRTVIRGRRDYPGRRMPNATTCLSVSGLICRRTPAFALCETNVGHRTGSDDSSGGFLTKQACST